MTDLESIADRLYGLRPDEFSAARDDEVKKARAAGQQPLARDLAKLRKPSQSAWLINLLWRDQREVLEQMLLLAEEMSRAQEQASGAALQRLTMQRRQLQVALIQRARALGEEAGLSVSASMEREAQDTLAAALAQPEVADQVRSGRLVKPASYAGFGTFPGTTAARPAPAHSPDDDDEAAAPEPTRIDEVAARRKRERREAAEQRVDEARAAVKASAATLRAESDKADAAGAEHEALAAQILKLRDQLSRVEREASTAQRNREHAERTHTAALKALEQAERELKELD